MARKDVDLVIRARDQAKGAISSVTKALEQFVESQNNIPQTAAQTDSALERLGSSLANLNKSLGGVDATTRVAAELERARASVERLSRSTAEATGEAIGYTRESRQAARATAGLRMESDRIAASIADQRQQVSQARNAQNQLNKTTANATRDRQRLAEADRRLSIQIDAQVQKLNKAESAYRELQTQISETDGPTTRLTTRLEAKGRSIQTTRARLDELRTTQSVVSASMDATSRSIERANDLYGQQAGELNQQTSLLERLEQKQKEVSASVKASAANQSRLDAAARNAAGGLTSQIASLERAQAGYRELQGVSKETEGALARLEDRVRGPLLKSFGQQARTIARLRQEYEKASAEATELGRDMARADNPSDELISSFETQRSAAARARAEFRQQREELARLRRILRETGGDVSALKDRQQRFQTVLARAGSAYRQYTSETERAAAANRRAGLSLDRLTRSQNQSATATARAAREQRTLAGALRSFYGESRQALSFTQRLRSEVIALTTAYVGFFAAIQQIQGVVEAYQQLEGAQSRLNALFDGDQSAIATELDFIRRNAERLGVEFGVLANEYTKFAIATKNTNLQGEETRRIFISVAEAARVNRATTAQLQGTFIALQQIASKGTVSMEELKQQLGDRLVGAVQIMADAAGRSVDELFKIIEAGELSSDILSEFADQLDKRFGPALAATLVQTTAQIGRLENAFFQARLRIARGGFLESFNNLLQELTTTIQSAGFESFLDRLSIALAAGADAVAFLASNFNTLIILLSGMLALKISPFITLLVGRLGLLTGASVSTARGFRAMSVAINTGAVSMTRAQVAARGLAIALRGLLSSTGIGLAVVLIGGAIGHWVTRTEEATEVLNTHRKLVDTVRNAYDQVGGSIEDIGEKLEGITATQARANLKALEDQLRSIRREFEDAIPRRNVFFGGVTNAGGGFFEEVNSLFSAFNQGEINVDDFVSSLDALNEQYRDMFPVNARFAETFDEIARRLAAMTLKVGEARDILITQTGSADEAAKAYKRLGNEAQEVEESAEEAAKRIASLARSYAESLQKLRKLVPSLSEEFKDLDQRARLENATKAALELAGSYAQVLQVLRLYEKGIDDLNAKQVLKVFDGADSSTIGSAAALIRSREGFRSLAYNDPRTDRAGNQVGANIFRAGFGSDTITLSDGTIKKISEGMRVTREDADRDLIRRINEFQNIIRGQIGEGRFESFSPRQQAVLTSIAYNYGQLPRRIIEAVRNGTDQQISDSIRGLGSDNGGINRGRRNQEAIIFGASPDRTGAGDQFLIRQAEERAKLAEKERKEREEANADTLESIENGKFQIEQQRLVLVGKEREAAINEAIRTAQEKNAHITEQQLAQIREQAGLLFDLEQQEKNLLTAKEAAEKAETRVNDLLLLRKQIQTELAIQFSDGAAPEVLAALTDQFREVNNQIQEAIDNAIRLFEALNSSDPAVAAIISRLRELKITSADVSGEVKIQWKDIEKILSNSLVNAANKFARSLADGKSVTDSLRDAFRQFAADFLRQIAQMIIQQLALNAAKSIGRALGFVVAHEGGIVGQKQVTRRLNVGSPMVAQVLHGGGIAGGLGPNEVAAVLERDEEVLTSDDPRHIRNLGKGRGRAGAGQGTVLKVVNAFSAQEFMSEALNSREGEETFLNFVRTNSASVRAALET